MIKKTVLFSGRRTLKTRIRITLPLSLLFHLLLIAVIAGGSVTVASDNLPEVTVIRIAGLQESPIEPGVPPAPRGSADTPGISSSEVPHSTPGDETADLLPDRLEAPSEIPKDILEEPIDFAGLLADTLPGTGGPGIPGGVEDGGTDPVVWSPAVIDPAATDRKEPLEIKTPRLIRRVKPPYSPVMIRAGVEGRVVLRAVTDIYGRVSSLEILHSDHPLLNSPSKTAVRQWLYEPYIVNGVPRPVRFTVTLTFTLIRKDH